MTAVTERTYKVSWEHPGEVPDLVLEAKLQLTSLGLIDHWNGWLIPYFDYATMKRYELWSVGSAAADETFAGMVITQHGSAFLMEGEAEAIRPDPETGLYQLGGGGWTWQIIDHDGPAPCDLTNQGWDCPGCDRIEDESARANQHGEPCWYTLKATMAERIAHYETRTPQCDSFPGEACPECGTPTAVHLDADQCQDRNIDTRDGRGCAIFVGDVVIRAVAP